MTYTRKARFLIACFAAATTWVISTSSVYAETPLNSKNNAVSISGTLVKPGKPNQAYTYDPQLAPAGSQLTGKVEVYEQPGSKSTRIALQVTGLNPNRGYGAHVHTKPCGPTGEDAGPHYQRIPDPVQPSVDPAYANPDNEVWLDFTTDAQGNAQSVVTKQWIIQPKQVGSIVIHSELTHTEPGKAGTAGTRIACLSMGQVELTFPQNFPFSE